MFLRIRKVGQWSYRVTLQVDVAALDSGSVESRHERYRDSPYPPSASALPVRGLYLQERLHELGTPASPLVYASFVSSLDGRIALVDPASGNALEGLTSVTIFACFKSCKRRRIA